MLAIGVPRVTFGPPDVATESTGAADLVDAAFGASNRARLLAAYFAAMEGERPAWEHVYRLLLWVDRTNALAHCYESDKCQPGKPWYGRSLAFHDWVSRELKVAPRHLATELDWMFRHASTDLAATVLRKAERAVQAGMAERGRFASAMPEPGEDPELVAIIREVLGSSLIDELSPSTAQLLVQRIRQHMTIENKRKNLLGEGFEDVIAYVVARSAPTSMTVRARARLHELPGFNRARQGDKDNKVDLAILRGPSGLRTLVTAKWSLRADREKDFPVDFEDYNNAEALRQPFEYVFVTNEFDPARLKRACEYLVRNAYMFNQVVHINPEALRATYGADAKDTMKAVLGHIESGRLIGLDAWIARLVGT